MIISLVIKRLTFFNNFENFKEEELKNEPKPEYVWVHMTCVMFLPELYFGNKVYMKNIEGIIMTERK